MSDPPGTSAAGRGAGEELLIELEAALSEQLALAKVNDLDKLEGGAPRVEELLRLAGEISGPVSPQSLERLERIGLLYKRLGLTIAQRKAELGGQLGRLRQGRTTLRAYRGGTGR